MKLSNAASYFDQLVVADAYTPATTFLAQLNLYDDSVRDGMTVERRVISTAPSVSIPSRRAIAFDGLQWLVGDMTPDVFGNEVIRRKYPIHRCDGLATLKTIQQALQAAAGSTAYTGLVWSRGAKEIEVSAGVFDVLNAYFSSYETVAERTLISLNSKWHLTRTVYRSSAGFNVALVDELPEPVIESATFVVRTYNPVTDSYSTSNSAQTVLRVRWQSAFEYLSAATEPYSRGDLQCMVQKTVTPKVQDTVTLSDGSWRVLSILDEGTYWSMHLRRA